MELSADSEGLDAALAALNESHTLGRYELLLPLGRGGMAVVWAARSRGTRGFSRIVAIKTMLPALSSDPRFEKMFLAEAQIASTIEHPNVCRILDLGEDDGILYLVMEWIDGEPLSTLLSAAAAREAKMPYEVAAAIVAAAARGLHAAHDPYGIVHRDVSPQNILVDRQGLVRIVDFGVAKAAQGSDQVSQSGFIKGKVGYLAPEQIRSSTIDGRADLFALGTVLYELTTGTHPFRGATDLDTLLHIASPDPPRPPDREDFPAELRAVLDRALAKDPHARFRSMHELALALEAYADAHDPAGTAIATFVREILDERRLSRERALEEAILEADRRAERKRTEADVDSQPPVSRDTRPRSSRWVASVIGVGIVAAGIGALGGRFSTPTSSNMAAASSSIAPAAALAPAAPAAPPAPKETTSAPAAASSAPPEAPALQPRAARDAPVVRPQTSPGPSAAAVAPAAVPAASVAPKTRFREPDF